MTCRGVGGGLLVVRSEQYLTQRWSRRLFVFEKTRAFEPADLPVVNCQKLEAALADANTPMPKPGTQAADKSKPGKEINMRDVVVLKVRPAKKTRTDQTAEGEAAGAGHSGLAREKNRRPAHRAKGI